ncbi:MAG: carboxymuconolactone decarboxylase family protein [Chloroflexi bacterium]|nr:carboxymuconolactone decarboxylase family protein [Chloroflexota bacterium]
MSDNPSIQALLRDRGQLYSSLGLAVEMDPELMGHFYEIMKIARLEGDQAARPGVVLGPTIREFITIALLASLRSADGLRLHIKRVLDAGATPQEVFEALEPCLVTVGAPAFLAGVEALAAVLQEASTTGAANPT